MFRPVAGCYSVVPMSVDHAKASDKPCVLGRNVDKYVYGVNRTGGTTLMNYHGKRELEGRKIDKYLLEE